MEKGKRFRPTKKSAPEINLDKSVPKQEDGTDNPNQERIAEGLSVPLPRLSSAPRPSPALAQFVGQVVRLQLKDGTVITGTYKYLQGDHIRLENVIEEGKGYRLSASWLLVDASTVARIGPADAKLEKVQ